MKVLDNACNPYAAPQVVRTHLPRRLPVALDHLAFPWTLVWQGLRVGTIAGSFASLVIMFAYLLRIDTASAESFFDLLGVCVCFLLATMALGLFWGFNNAIINWILRRSGFEVQNDDWSEP